MPHAVPQKDIVVMVLPKLQTVKPVMMEQIMDNLDFVIVVVKELS